MTSRPIRPALKRAGTALLAACALGAHSPGRAQGFDPGAVAEGPRPEEPFQALPLMTWQQELELNTTVRQVLFNAYLPFLARPTDYRGVHNDAIPNQVPDWFWHRDDVQRQLRGRQDTVDAQRRGRGALPDAEINALIGRKQAFRPEQLEKLLTGSPRIDDLIVTVRRVQALGMAEDGREFYRVDFDVKTTVGAITENTSFDRVDIIHNIGTWVLPTRVITEVAPLSRAATAATSRGFDPLALAASAVEVVMGTARSISPVPIPPIPFIETP